MVHKLLLLVLFISFHIGCDGFRARVFPEPAMDENTTQQSSIARPDKTSALQPQPTHDDMLIEPGPLLQQARLRTWPDSIVDGDTIKAVGFGRNLRLLHLDTEEVFNTEDRELFSRGWKSYLQQKSAQSSGFGTPMGEHAKEFALNFFEGIEEIFVEYESPIRTGDYFERHLVYVWVKKQGDSTGWLNYNIEAVRAGMSPYYMKYGYSERYHAAFELAEKQARDAKRGIWAPGAMAYNDYDSRIAAWRNRADQIALFRARFANSQKIIELGTDTATAELRQQLGSRVTVFGSILRHYPRARPPRLHLSHRHREEMVIVSSPSKSIEAFDIDLDQEDYVYVDGIVTLWRGMPQLELDAHSKISSGAHPPSLPRREVSNDVDIAP